MLRCEEENEDKVKIIAETIFFFFTNFIFWPGVKASQ